MSGDFQKKTSGIIVSFILGLLIISFMFSGFQSQNGTADTVATVGSEFIRANEYRRALDQQIKMYSQFTGGKSLTNKQIKRFGIRKNTIGSLVNQKLQLTLANEVGISPSEQAIRDEIKNLPYFLTNKKFDITKYKQLLSANSLTPSTFEQEIKGTLRLKSVASLLNSFPISSSFAKDFSLFKKMGVAASIITVTQSAMLKRVHVSSSEVTTYFKKEANLARAKALFKSKKSILDIRRSVQASHILVKEEDLAKKIFKKLNSGNFKKFASKHTIDPSGKKNGGSLNWFSEGKMVPEFDKIVFSMKKGSISKPFKSQFGWHIVYLTGIKPQKLAAFEKYKKQMGIELIQKNKKDEVKALVESISSKVFQKLSINQYPTKLIKKFSLTSDRNITLNPLENSITKLSDSQLSEVLRASQNGKRIFTFKTPIATIIVKTSPLKATDPAAAPKEVRKTLSAQYSRLLQAAFTKRLRQDTKVTINSQLL